MALSGTNGSQVWVYRGAGKGYAASPAIDGGRVYIGSKDGRFHSVDAANGQAVWTFQVGSASDAGAVAAPILASAAVRAGRVYFGAENMNAYALDAATGARLWRRAVRGQSFGHTWPVASGQAGGLVLFRTTPIYAFHDLLNSDEAHLQAAAGTSGGTLGDKAAWIVEQRAVSQRLRDNPHRRSLWELNAATGADRYALPLPVVYTSGVGDAPAPPVVDDSTNRAWIMTRSVYARFDGMGVRNYGEFAKLNLAFDPAIYSDATLPEDRLGIRFFGCRGSSNCKIAWEDFHKIADEGEVLTAASNAVFSSNWVSAGGIDLGTEATFNVRFYSSDDTGGAGLYGSQTGAVVANGRIVLRDSQGIKSYTIPR
ncbi:MAG TPA: hypothetical protein DEH78_32300 [Solibacterales bacterium]|nr:hypothetical protein [Bryobacterales bacterium]